MEALWLPCIPQWDRSPSHSRTSGTCQAGAAKNSLPFFATLLYRPMLQTAGRPGWHAKKGQQGTYPRDIVQKEPKSAALGPNVSHWRSKEKINCTVKLRGEFAPEAVSDGAPQCQTSPWRGCSPSPAAWGGQTQSSDGTNGAGCEHCSASFPFFSHGQGKIQNQFTSMLLNTVLVSGVHFQKKCCFCLLFWLLFIHYQQTFHWCCILTAPPSSCRFLHDKHICLKFKEFPHVPGTVCAMAGWMVK